MDDSSSLVPGGKDWILKNKWSAVIGLFGLFLLFVGLGQWWNEINSGQKSIEVIEADSIEKSDGKLVVIDVSGAVLKPGVYQLASSARVGEAIEAAGGFAEGADTTWVSKTVNLAQEIKDGLKIYVPFKGDAEQLGSANLSGAMQASSGSNSVGHVVNINTATVAELESLWGIGESRANSIVSARPYQNIEEIIDKAGVPRNVFERIESEITVY